MLTWDEFKRSLNITSSVSPVMREKAGKKYIFWFRNGNGEVADLLTKIRQKIENVEIIWDEQEGLTGICVHKEQAS